LDTDLSTKKSAGMPHLIIAKNKIQAIGSLVVPVLGYDIGINWNKKNYEMWIGKQGNF
jgi:hypothetical protein